MRETPCHIPSLAIGKEELDFWNAAISHSGRKITIEETQSVFSFCSTAAPAEPRSGYLVTMANGAKLLLIFEEFPFAEWFDADLDIHDVAQLSAGMQEAINTGILNVVRGYIPLGLADLIEQICWKPASELIDSLDDPPFSWIEISLFGETESPIKLIAGLNPQDLLPLLGAGEHILPSVEQALVGAVQCSLYYSIGSIELTLQDVNGLTAGDLIALGANFNAAVLYVTNVDTRYVFNRDEAGWICDRSFVWPGHRNRNAWQENGGRGLSDEIEDEDGEIEQEDAGSQFAKIPVLVEFEIGQLSLPASEIGTWQAGSVVLLDPPQLSETVEINIRANGQLLASGDLVRIDDRLAVKVTRLLTGKPAGIES
jgi:flagellar motor switch/type III secretory pathway protein FliN